jgi:hypothetical protein
MTAENQLAQKDKNKFHMRSFRLEMKIDEINIKMEMDRRQKKREWNSMSPKENTEMHMKARGNMKKICLAMSPKKRQEMTAKSNNGMKSLQLIMSPKKGRNELERMQQDKEFTHVSQKRQNERESTQWDEEFMHVSQKKQK